MPSEQLSCLDGIMAQHQSRYGWFLRMVDLRLRELIASGDAQTVTADDAHAILDHLGCPKNADRRFLGALWKRGWVHVGYQRSTRCACHHRAISVFRLAS